MNDIKYNKLIERYLNFATENDLEIFIFKDETHTRSAFTYTKEISELIGKEIGRGKVEESGEFIKFKVKDTYAYILEKVGFEFEDSNNFFYNIDKRYLSELPMFVRVGEANHSQAYPIGTLINIITSKPFIESIARGISRKMGDEWEDDILYMYKGELRDYEQVLLLITTDQSIAIRDGTLNDFINKLLPKKLGKK